MIMDDVLVVSDAQSLAGAGSAYSTDEINFGEAGPNMGEGSPLIFRFIIEEAFATCDSVQFVICHSATANATTQLVMTAAILTASLTKGAWIPELKLPEHHLQYVRIYYVIAGSNPTTGKVTAYLDNH